MIPLLPVLARSKAEIAARVAYLDELMDTYGTGVETEQVLNARATSESDAFIDETKLRYVTGIDGFGLELIVKDPSEFDYAKPPGEEDEPMAPEVNAISENLREIIKPDERRGTGREIRLVMHAPFSRPQDQADSEGYLNSPTSLLGDLANARKALEFAKEVGIDYVTFHVDDMILGPRTGMPAEDLSMKKQMTLTQIYQNMNRLGMQVGYTNWAIENAVNPAFGEIEAFQDPSRMPYEWVMESDRDMQNFVTAGGRLCLDVSHKALTDKRLKRAPMAFGSDDAALYTIGADDAREQKSFYDLAMGFGERNVPVIYVSDVKGMWLPNGRGVANETMIYGWDETGQDGLNRAEMKPFFGLIKHWKSFVGIEAHEPDYKDPTKFDNAKRALNRVLEDAGIQPSS